MNTIITNQHLCRTFSSASSVKKSTHLWVAMNTITTNQHLFRTLSSACSDKTGITPCNFVSQYYPHTESQLSSTVLFCPALVSLHPVRGECWKVFYPNVARCIMDASSLRIGGKCRCKKQRKLWFQLIKNAIGLFAVNYTNFHWNLAYKRKLYL